MFKEIFVNLPVKDLGKTKEFFSKLGLKFNQQFTDQNAACLIINDKIYAMLITESYFKTFITKEIADTKKSSEVILALSVYKKEQVDEIANKAIKAGGKEPRKAQDHGWMYSRNFEDLDGHLWEVFHMDINKMPKP
jgi:predicted lactoylglutathione lyase